MSVTGTNDGWERMEKQPLAAVPTLSASDSPGHFDFQIEVPVAGGVLGRSETAELVALIKNGIFVSSTGAGASSPAQVHGYHELSRSADAQVQAMQQNAGTEQQDLTSVADDGSGQITLTGQNVRVTELENDVLDHGSPHNANTYEDDAAGHSSGGTMHMDHHTVDFRGMFGQGPVFDYDDDLYLHLSLNNPQSNNGANFYYNATLVWDIL